MDLTETLQKVDATELTETIASLEARKTAQEAALAKTNDALQAYKDLQSALTKING